MTGERFNLTVQAFFAECERTLKRKALEYAPGDDRLAHFKSAAELQACSPREALWSMAAKHMVSLSGMVKSGRAYDAGLWTEKLMDITNYCLLLRALIEEETNA
ncbi:MAG: hypothetical protein LBS11_10530 [Oscillospiraceae bacterium]|jgi:hypothetical protein|nr:hypothetical protein [Oscillospiraceae bacterium]